MFGLWPRYGRYATVQKARSTATYAMLLAVVAVIVIGVAMFFGDSLHAAFADFGKTVAVAP